MRKFIYHVGNGIMERCGICTGGKDIFDYI